MSRGPAPEGVEAIELIIDVPEVERLAEDGSPLRHLADEVSLREFLITFDLGD